MLVSVMGSPILTQSEWDEVRKGAEAGLNDEELAVEFGIPKNAIRQRRLRDKNKGNPWLTPKELKLAAEIEELKAKSKVAGNGVTSVTEGSALSGVTAKMAKLREETPLLIAEKVAELIAKGLENLVAPKGWKEMSVANSILSGHIYPKGGGVNIAIGQGMQWGQSAPENGKPVIVVSG